MIKSLIGLVFGGLLLTTHPGFSQDSLYSGEYRPGFHFTPQQNWMNDPNGLVYYQGVYHLFFQYNPYGNHWGHMSWGHAVSADLFHWKEQPVALREEKDINDPDTTMIFSGSMVIDNNNTSHLFADSSGGGMVAIYTGHVHNHQKPVVQNQDIAFSVNGGKTWTKYPGNPVLTIHSTEFRDPKVFWYTPLKKWIMLVSKPDQHEIWFYASPDLRNWKFQSSFGKMGDTSLVWECPDMYALSTNDGSGITRWVLSVSSGNPRKGFRGMEYFVGTFNGIRFVPDREPYPRYVDYGKDYYAGVTYNNIPAGDGRSIMIGWADNWNYAAEIPTRGYRGIFALPRSLAIKKISGFYQLVQQPVKELDQLHGELHSLGESTLDNNSERLGFSGNSLDLRLQINPGEGSIAGIKLLENGTKATVLSFDRNRGVFSLDRTNSGYTDFNKDFPGIDTVKLPPLSASINLRIIIDKCILEVFINDGEATITDLVFPTGTDNRISLFSRGGKTTFSKIKWYRVIPSMND